MKSIIQERKVCYFCSTPYSLAKHHIYFGNGRRKISEQNGFTVWLCNYHHNMSDKSVHFDKALDLYIKRECQEKYESMGHSREEFIKLIGRNYLGD